MKVLYRWWSILLPIAVIVQISLVGVGAFHAAKVVDDQKSISQDSFDSWFGLHAAFGYIVVLLGLVFLLIALALRDGSRIKLALGVLGLLVLQVVLAWLAFGVPALGWLHPINALAILVVTGRNAAQQWKAEEIEAMPAIVPTA
jgi:FtsH-binding integral membrane protein